jgi:hypothetical protein
MRPSRLAVRAAAVLPVALLSACTDQDVSNAISDWIKAALWFMAKMILISLALLVTWAFAAMLGAGLIAAGVRRRRFDVLTVLAVLGGVGLIVGAWPLVFSQDGLAGVIAPGSTGHTSAGPIAAQALALFAVVVAVIMFMRRRDARKRAATPPPEQPTMPVAPPPPLPTPTAPRPRSTGAAKNGSKNRKPAASRAGKR